MKDLIYQQTEIKKNKCATIIKGLLFVENR